MTAYDFARDQERMALNHSIGNHKPEQPWQIYRNGYRLGGFATFADACEWANKEEIMGNCMISNPFEPPPSFPLFGAGYDAGYCAGLEVAAQIAEAAMTCGCNNAHGPCMSDDAPRSIAAEIRSRIPAATAEEPECSS